MPTVRFYKLNSEKKQRIWNAAFHEFSRVPLEKASINRIIREAKISRGSYYTYFSDKWDLLMYVMEEAGEHLYAQMCLSLEESQGEIWKMLEQLLKYMLEMCSEREKKEFLKNVLGFSQERMDRKFWEKCIRPEQKTRQDILSEEIYQKCAGVSIVQMKKEEFQVFLQMALFLLEAEVRMALQGDSEYQIWNRYRVEERILKRGVGIPDSRNLETERLSAMVS